MIIDAGGDVTADLGDHYEADALVEWASVTKTVTAAAVLVLLAERDIPRDTPARDLLPDVPDDATYTVDDLIRHRSGLPRVHQGMSAGVVGDPYADVSEADITRALRQTPTTPGERDYSNLGYAVLGRLLEHVAQERWSTVVEADGPRSARHHQRHPRPGTRPTNAAPIVAGPPP
ncbi:serine hydrolase domain-containing protein [Curtobacterium flaccumfaciens]|nr:serine hydrolase domain-containing protein [Curtobacterium flaccumfaciens]